MTVSLRPQEEQPRSLVRAEALAKRASAIVVDGQRGRQLGFAIPRLEQLIEAYRNHDLQQRP
jgi:hypothetical protein